jgi:hypothetical protein
MTKGWRLVQAACLAALMTCAGGRAWAQKLRCGGGVHGAGVIEVPKSLNGTFEVCVDLDPRVPQLQNQLNELQRTLNGNDALLREVTHAVRGVNALSGNVDTNRQAEMLQSLSKQIQGWLTAGQKESQQQIAQLSYKLDTLQEAIEHSKEDQRTALQTTAELNGPLGDSIAALDLTKAQEQLDSIQAKLDKIGDDTGQIRRTIEEQNAREKEAAELERKKAEEQDKDPNMYTRAQIMPSKSPLNNQLRLMIFFYSRPPLYPPFVDSAFSVSFRKGTAAWRMDAGDKQVSAGGELWHLNLNPDDIGDQATFCFVAHDKPSGRLKEWTQHYKVTPANTASLGYNFVPDGDAAMHLTDGEPCDGVKEVRKEQSPPDAPRQPAVRPGMPSAEDLLAQRTKVQEQIAAMRANSLAALPAAPPFAKITAEGSRRDGVNGGQWEIKVSTQPLRPGTPLYDVRVEANLVDESGRALPLQLSNRQLFVNIESRYARVDRLGTRAVVCLTAKDPAGGKERRLTQWFSIETSRVLWRDPGGQVPGDKATFVPAQPPTLTDASGAACQ